MVTHSFLYLKKQTKRILLACLITLPTIASAIPDLKFDDDNRLIGASNVQVEGYDNLFSVTFHSGSFISTFANNDLFVNDASILDISDLDKANSFSQALMSQVLLDKFDTNPLSVASCGNRFSFEPSCRIRTAFNFEDLSSVIFNDTMISDPGQRLVQFSEAVNFGMHDGALLNNHIASGSDYMSYQRDNHTWANWKIQKVPEIDTASLPLSIGLMFSLLAFIRERKKKFKSA